MDYEYIKLKEKLNNPDGKRLISRFLSEYNEKFLDKPINTLSYSFYKQIYITGDRTKFQQQFNERRERLLLLQVLALADDKYLDDLEDIIASICDEYTWIWPAHSLKDKEKGEFNYQTIDLYNAQTALCLSETYHIFEDKLSFDIKYRIKDLIKKRVVDVFENNTFWYETKFGTNWTSVCGGSVGCTYLYLFPERFVLVKDRLFALCEDYIRGIHDDGVCEEGTSYWLYGFGFLSIFIELYKEKFNEIPGFMESEKINKTLDYYLHSMIGGKNIQVGDEGCKDVKNYPPYEVIIKKLFPDKFMLPDYDFVGQCNYDARVLSVRVLDSIGRWEKDKKRDNKKDEFSRYYNNSQLFILNSKKYAFSVKGGNNQEMHNHNDIGAFTLLVKGKKIISDLGGGKYTWDYFNNKDVRYGDEVFVCGSQGHSVPIVDGKKQEFGREYKAEYIYSNDKSVKFAINKAYGIDDLLTAEYITETNGIKVKYHYEGIKRQITFRFISDYAPKISCNTIEIENVSVICDKQCEIFTDKHAFERTNESCIAYSLDYKYTPSEKFDIEFCFNIKD